MAGEIERQGKITRPTFNHAGPGSQGFWTNEQVIAQMTESIRNICEYQLAQIERTNKLLASIIQTINRIDRRLSQVREFKIQGGKHGQN